MHMMRKYNAKFQGFVTFFYLFFILSIRKLLKEPIITERVNRYITVIAWRAIQNLNRKLCKTRIHVTHSRNTCNIFNVIITLKNIDLKKIRLLYFRAVSFMRKYIICCNYFKLEQFYEAM